MSESTPVLFLPGASGRGEFWDPVREHLADVPTRALDWPGLGGTPASPSVGSYDDLVALVRAQLRGPTTLVGQSMGGYVAVRVALAAPQLVSHLVLAVTSAGVDMHAMGARDWRPAARAARPDDPEWIYEPQADLAHELSTIDIPTLLVWADRDEISPLSVGRRLAELIPGAELVVLPSDDHWVVRDHPAEVARMIRAHRSAS